MKIIEAMKKVKSNLVKIEDLHQKILSNCSNYNHETPLYEDTQMKIDEWCQACDDLSQENIRLLCAIQRTNLQTEVTIELNDKHVTKTIAEWIWRRREYSKIDFTTWAKLSDRNLKEGIFTNSVGQPQECKIVRHYDPVKRDKMVEMYKAEASLIDASLEVINAVTDLKE